MTDKNDYLIKLFDKYNEILEHCNKPCKNMYSKDEFWTRHNVFKDLQKDMRSYSYMIFIQNLKQKIRNFKDKLFRRKRKKNVPTVPDVPPAQTVQSEPTVALGQNVQSEPTTPPGQTTQSEQANSPGQNVQSEPTTPPEQAVQEKSEAQREPTVAPEQKEPAEQANSPGQTTQSEPTAPPIKKRRGRKRKKL